MGLSVEKKLARALALAGNTYTLDDILFEISEGRMQSFVQGDTWVVTQFVDYPRKRYLEIVLAVGAIQDIRDRLPQIEDFAKQHLAEGLRVFGRPGWARQFEIDRHGWVETTRLYVKEF